MRSSYLNSALKAVGIPALVSLMICGLGGACAADPPQIGPAFGIGSVSVSAPYSQEAAAAAGAGGQYLVVWLDRRSGLQSVDAESDIYGIFVDGNGQPLGTESFLISSTNLGLGAAGDQIHPAVAFNGTHYLVVWTDYRAGVANPHIYGARVATDGTVLDPNGIAISTTATTYQDEPAVASNGTDWQVVYQEYVSGYIHLVGARVQANGAIASRATLISGAYNKTVPAIVWNGTNYLLVWEDERSINETNDDIYGVRVSSTNTLVGSAFLISTDPSQTTSGAPGAQSNPTVAVGPGGTCLVTWDDRRGANRDVYGARVSSAGAVLNHGGILISGGASDQQTPAVGWDGSNYVVVWRDGAYSRTVRGARVNSTGSVLDPTGFAVSNAVVGSRGPDIASGNGSSVAVYYTLSVTNSDVLGSSISGGAAYNKDTLIGKSAQDQPAHAAAFDGSNYVTVWADRRSGTYAIYAARVATDGLVLDPQGVKLWESSAEQTEPAIAWGNGRFLVVWTEGKGSAADIKGMRIDSDLNRLDAQALAINSAPAAQTSPCVAWNGTTWAVAWVHTPELPYVMPVPPYSSYYFTTIRGVRVSSAGAITALSGAIDVSLGYQYTPCMTSDGSNFFVVWRSDRYLASPETWYPPELYCARISTAGTVMDANGIKVSTATANKTLPAVAFDGANYLIVWTDSRGDFFGQIYGVRMSKTAARVDASDIAICAFSQRQDTPAVVWTGSNYYVVWQDYRAGGVSGCDIYVARMLANGTVVDPNGLPLATETCNEFTPKIASGGSDWTAVFYSRQIYSINRLTGRTCGTPLPVIVPTIGDAKDRPNGYSLTVKNKIVTAGNNQLAGRFYIEDPDRSAGIKVVGAGTWSEGNVVDVTGVLDTVDGERQITATSVTLVSPSGVVPAPFVLGVRGLAGGPLNEFTPGVHLGSGANNTGLLVKISGKVLNVGADHFYLDDGTMLRPPGTEPEPYYAKIVCPAGVSPPAAGTFVVLTGISSCEPVPEGLIRRLLLRKPQDIVTVP